MDHNKDNDDAEESGKDYYFFIAGSSSSDDEGEIDLSRQKSHSICEQTSKFSRESSPPLLLAFNIPSGGQNSSPSPASSLNLQEEHEDEDGNQPIEEWMILGEEEQVGDSSIQLNLSYWNSSEVDSGNEDQNMKSVENTWAVSEKDKSGAYQSPPVRYFVPGRSLNCNICNRMGHLAKSCHYHKKCPTCVLCGIQGHIQRDCPAQPCSSCGLPSHGVKPCQRPPLWNQHCLRCGMAGHLFDACPDTWRQYHLTVSLSFDSRALFLPHFSFWATYEVFLKAPCRPQTVYTQKQKKCPAYCYNCSERGHYGYECTKRRMISGTFPSLPYVCHYDTLKDIYQRRTEMQKRAKDLSSAGSSLLLDQQQSEPKGESSEENQPTKGRSRTKQETCSRTGRRKTWPERRRERREVKRLRREAQARREGGLLGRSLGNFDNDVCPTEPFMSSFKGPKWSTLPSNKKKRKNEEGGKRSRKSRETKRWKKGGGLKHGDLYSHGDTEISSESPLPKHRVRHRRR